MKKVKQKTIKQRRRKETNAERKLRRYKIDCDRNRVVNEARREYQKQLDEAIKAAEDAEKIKENAVEIKETDEAKPVSS